MKLINRHAGRRLRRLAVTKHLIHLTLAVLFSSASCNVIAASQHAISLYGTPKYPPSFTHFDYNNPQAPKGGSLKLDAIGTFDSLNPWILKGNSAAGLSRIYDTLTVASLDEPFTQYGLLAESVELADDRSWEVFHLNPKATFSDGTKVSADDVAFTYHQLIDNGSPFWGFYYKDVTSVEVLDKRTVRFNFKPNASRELPLIIGQMAILPKHYWQHHKFNKTTLVPPVGSGPYRISEIKPGKRIVYQRREDYWGKSLPVNRGLYNVDRISYDYYQDDTVALEAFKGGAYDFRMETSAQRWATGYQGKALDQGEIIKQPLPSLQPAGMQAFVFNLRKPIFQDRTLRRAISLAFDFQWTNKTLFYGQYKRTRSYFQNSEMAATTLPTKAELALLEPFRDQLPPAVFNQVYQPPVSQGEGRPRDNLKKAWALLNEAGYSLKNNQLYNPNGVPIKFEFLLYQPAFERVVLPFIGNLKILGINVTARRVDQPQYINRLRNFEYDMVVASFPQSSSPGSEQRIYWSSTAASRKGSQNYIGISNPVVDSLVDKLVDAHSREQLITRCRALDRVLQWGFYVIPNWYNDHFRLAYRHHLGHPTTSEPLNSISLDSWWDKKALTK